MKSVNMRISAQMNILESIVKVKTFGRIRDIFPPAGGIIPRLS
jgi:hypothetical protein